MPFMPPEEFLAKHGQNNPDLVLSPMCRYFCLVYQQGVELWDEAMTPAQKKRAEAIIGNAALQLRHNKCPVCLPR